MSGGLWFLAGMVAGLPFWATVFWVIWVLLGMGGPPKQDYFER